MHGNPARDRDRDVSRCGDRTCGSRITSWKARPIARRSFGGQITPELVILHDTAGRLTKGNSADYLRTSPGGTSVHFIVERDGSIEQQVPTNRRAGHAGKSSYHGRTDCNAFSIGTEIVNPGRMDAVAGQQNVGRAWWGQNLQGERPGDTVVMATPEHGTGAWMSYPAEQIDAIDQLLTALFAAIHTLHDIRTHWYVSRGRKVDTNPLFPLEQLRTRILGRDDPADLAAEAASVPGPTDDTVRIKAASGLNMRAGPAGRSRRARRPGRARGVRPAPDRGRRSAAPVHP
ncbi:N-acetylmuramoyl-L-alanine amidase [Paracoccus haematequi]|uniref:N-acetylmuramoyl-L-alanine amidase n=1 Tax=Paracoccus haematequi TaxID=2491866 RepID=UPI001F49B3BC|nr:N-acetylmuramoyl-L-alanine amidase [Paracoccus haematequi]